VSLPYFPMFPTDFDADTGHLTFAEDGAYNRLLRLSWKCPGAKMPDDMDWIHRRARAVSVEEKALVASVIAEFFTRSGGKIFSRRLASEWQKSSLAHSKRVSAGSAGGKAKALKAKETCPSNAKAMLYQPEPEPEPTREIAKAISRDADFEAFWATVPKRTAKASARKAYALALRRASAETILAGMVRYAAERKGQDMTFTAHPATWLNADRWADEGAAAVGRPAAQSEDDKMAYRAECIRSGKDYLCRNISATAARELVAQGRVTEDQCKQAGVRL
jgi:uncharacterized protein YdaU (DUF1376 family)